MRDVLLMLIDFIHYFFLILYDYKRFHMCIWPWAINPPLWSTRGHAKVRRKKKWFGSGSQADKYTLFKFLDPSWDTRSSPAVLLWTPKRDTWSSSGLGQGQGPGPQPKDGPAWGQGLELGRVVPTEVNKQQKCKSDDAFPRSTEEKNWRAGPGRSGDGPGQ